MKWNEQDEEEMTKREWSIFFTGVRVGAFVGAMCIAGVLAWLGFLHI